MRPDDWRFDFHGLVTLPLRIGISSRPHALEGQKVTVLHEGSVLSEGSIDHVSEDPKVIEVYLGR